VKGCREGRYGRHPQVKAKVPPSEVEREAAWQACRAVRQLEFLPLLPSSRRPHASVLSAAQGSSVPASVASFQPHAARSACATAHVVRRQADVQVRVSAPGRNARRRR